MTDGILQVLTGIGALVLATSSPGADWVTAKQIIAAPAGEWLEHGRDYFEQRFSPLTQINRSNIKDLGLVWHYDFGDRQGLEATPIMHNGVIYVSTDFSEVWAFNARTGEKLWSFVPDTRYWQINTCCSPANRGVAIWGDKIYVGALDGRLIAISAKTGKQVWSTQTFPKSTRLSITGAPRVIKGVVVIGNGGAELGARGFVAGYDAETGKLKWKFYMVPGQTDHEGAASDSAMSFAIKTWHGEWWKLGGGGTPWDGMAYDPELDLLYIGGGNGSPWNSAMRSPGGGDNLFLGSVVALKPESGQYVWHFQETPGESWDYTSTQPIILADLKIDGVTRKTLLHAPKNGFFYVLDRATGAFIHGTNFAPVNWAEGLDAGGRPIENPNSRYGENNRPWMATPGAGGAHDWQPMSFSPKTGLAYFPVVEDSFLYTNDQTEGGTGRSKLGFNTGAGLFSANVRLPSAGPPPADANAAVAGAASAAVVSNHDSYLLAWDPVSQKAVWKAPHSKWTLNGGVLSTAGGLVFEGAQSGEVNAYADDTGKALWTFDAQTGVLAGPVSYELDGAQHIALMAGWGGASAGPMGHTNSNGPARLLVFKLGGLDRLPVKAAYAPPPLISQPLAEPIAVVDRGASLFSRYCQRCHGGGAAGGGLGQTGPADLRRSPFIQDEQAFNQVVVNGLLQHNGMAPFGEEVNPESAHSIRAYILYQAGRAMKAGVK
jgi:quinohemoprotein ethanol dehydrogenase